MPFLGAILEDRKTDLRSQVVFSGLIGRFPGPDTDVILSTSLSGEKKKDLRVASIRKVLITGRISHKDMESFTGKLSPPKRQSSDDMGGWRPIRFIANCMRPIVNQF